MNTLDRALESRFAKLCVGAAINGAVAFLGVWSQTDDFKTLVTAGMLPFLSTFGSFIGLNAATEAIRSRRAAPSG